MSEEWAPPSGEPATPTPETETEKRKRTTAAQRWNDIPEVEAAPEGSVSAGELAVILGVHDKSIPNLYKSEGFPTPLGRKGRSVFHNPEEVKKWHSERSQSMTGRAIGGAARGAQKTREGQIKETETIDAVLASGKNVEQSDRPSPIARMIPGTASAAEQFRILDAYYGPLLKEAAERAAAKPKLSKQFDDLFFGG
jgi:hypothetical protein